MNPWEPENAADVLEDLNKLKKIIGIGEINDFGNMYFKSQLARYYYSLNIAYKYFKGKLIVDVGNYPGHLHKILLDKGFDIEGIDIKPERIPDRLGDCKKRTFVWDIENEKPPKIINNRYDAIMCLEVIEHLHVNPLNFLNSLSSILKLNGLMLLSTPNLLSLKHRINFILGKQVFEHPLSVYENLERHGSRGHQRIYSSNELADLLEVYGFEVIKIWPMDYKPPLLSKKKYKQLLTDSFDLEYFNSFWYENRSVKGRLRRAAEIKMNSIAPGLCDNLFILAKRTGEYDQELFFNRIAKSDPWMDKDKYSLKV